jgi:hypothetical protein
VNTIFSQKDYFVNAALLELAREFKEKVRAKKKLIAAS